MKIATVLLTHANVPITSDAIDSIETYVGNNNLVLVDQAGWHHFQNTKISKAIIQEGFYHNHHRSPYRNYALGLKTLYSLWPDSDWFLYTEYDCLFVSDGFKKDLDKAESLGAWCAGFDLRRFPFETPYLTNIIGSKASMSYYFLGSCQFLHRNLIVKLSEMNFFDTFLNATEKFQKGKFPGYKRYAYEEELWPTLATHLGGNLYELSCWKGGENQEHQTMKETDTKTLYAGKEHEMWRGHFKLYPVRNAPEIDNADLYPETSIIHPIKTYDHPIRLSFQDKRRLEKKKKLSFI